MMSVPLTVSQNLCIPSDNSRRLFNFSITWLLLLLTVPLTVSLSGGFHIPVSDSLATVTYCRTYLYMRTRKSGFSSH
jgi:hypothetical protein